MMTIMRLVCAAACGVGLVMTQPAIVVGLAGVGGAGGSIDDGRDTVAGTTKATVQNFGNTVDLIAFASCAREREEQPLWSEIAATKPDLFLFIGDNHYADVWEKDGKMGMRPVEKVERIYEAYEALAAKPGFAALRATVPLMATWDDHDYGANDAGKEFSLREESKKAFFDFYGEPAGSPLREQPGVYSVKSFGKEGRRVQVIMLDTRFNRDSLELATPEQRGNRRGPYRATADSTKTLLGAAQWAWLGEQLREPADVRLIVSSIQVVADEHGFETWGNFPHERRRLYDLIDSTNATGVVFLSGDRHLTEISTDRGGDHRNAGPYPMWDFTSSGLNLKPGIVTDANALRVGPVRREATFGTVKINWGATADQTSIELTALGDKRQLLTRQTVFLSELRKPRPGQQ